MFKKKRTETILHIENASKKDLQDWIKILSSVDEVGELTLYGKKDLTAAGNV